MRKFVLLAAAAFLLPQSAAQANIVPFTWDLSASELIGGGVADTALASLTFRQVVVDNQGNTYDADLTVTAGGTASTVFLESQPAGEFWLGAGTDGRVTFDDGAGVSETLTFTQTFTPTSGGPLVFGGFTGAGLANSNEQVIFDPASGASGVTISDGSTSVVLDPGDFTASGFSVLTAVVPPDNFSEISLTSISAQAVPEPTSFALCGLLGIGAIGRRRRRKLA